MWAEGVKRYSAEADQCPHCGEPSPTPGSEYIFRGVMFGGCCIVAALIGFAAFAAYFISR